MSNNKTSTEKLQEVRDAIVKAVPSLVQHTEPDKIHGEWICTKCGAYSDDYREGERCYLSPITLEDVLRAIGQSNKAVTCWPRTKQWGDFIIDWNGENKSWQLGEPLDDRFPFLNSCMTFQQMTLDELAPFQFPINDIPAARMIEIDSPVPAKFRVTFSEAIRQPEPIEEELRGSDLKPEDRKRLGGAYERVASVMEDGQWHSPEIIAERSKVRLDSALRMVRMMKKYGFKIEKKNMGSGLYLYRALLLFTPE